MAAIIFHTTMKTTINICLHFVVKESSLHVAHDECTKCYQMRSPSLTCLTKKGLKTKEVGINDGPSHFGPGPLGRTLHNRLYDFMLSAAEGHRNPAPGCIRF